MPVVAIDRYKSYKPLSHSAGRSAFVIVPSDTDQLPFVTMKLYVGTAGNIKVLLVDDSTPVILPNVPAGSVLELRIKQILATGTTASNMVGID